MTRNDLAPIEAPPTIDLTEILGRLTAAAEVIAQAADGAVIELKLFTPEEAAPLLGKTPNWVYEACQDGRIPCTYVGKSPRLTAKHIRQIAENGERIPRGFAKPRSRPARAA